MLNDGKRSEDNDIDLYDKYIEAEVILDDNANGAMRAAVKRRIRDFDGNVTGRVHRNPLLDTRDYEVEYADGTVDKYMANITADNLYSQVESKGKQFMVLIEIINHKSDGTGMNIEDGYVISHNGNKVPKKTTKGWKI
jgi:hypothetical protein